MLGGNFDLVWYKQVVEGRAYMEGRQTTWTSFSRKIFREYHNIVTPSVGRSIM